MFRRRFLLPLAIFFLVCIVLQPLEAFAIDTTYDLRLGPVTGAGYGWGYATAVGDINNDGYDDLIFAGDGNNRIHIHYGSATSPSATNSGTVLGPASINFGEALEAADVNNDGYDDIIVGAHAYSSDTGRVYVYYGGSSLDTTADVTLTGETSSQFGYSVSAGDVNNDGYADVIVGGYGYSTNTGRTYIFYGGSSMDSTVDVTLTGGVGDVFGNSVNAAGDVNNDGYADVLVGAPGYSLNTGRAYIYLGGASMDTTADVTLTGETSSQFGYSVSAGDVNNDGYDDVVIGAPSMDGGTGATLVYLGGASMNNTADVTIAGTSGSSMGSALTAAGDFNNDGYDDILVGAGAYPNREYDGRAYIFYGGSTMNNTADVTFDSENTGDYNDFAGYNTPLSHGDLNGDKAADIVIGAPGAVNGNYDGAVYVYMGTDNVAPAVSTFSPADNATSVSPTANLVLTFDEVTRAGTGTLTIKKSSDDSTVETITVSGSLLSGNGSTSLTLNPSTTLSEDTSYYIVWSANAFKDAARNHVAAVTSSSTWNFTTSDTTAPTLSSLSPADNSTHVLTTTNLALTFNEAVRTGTGTITLRRWSDQSIIETITATDTTLVSGSGTTTITINPTDNLLGSRLVERVFSEKFQ